MKRTIKATTLCAAALCAAALTCPSANANQINGSIGFGASGVTINTTSLATASTFGVDHAFTTSESGDYSSVPLFSFVTFNGFQFNPTYATESVRPLWTFNIGSTDYSFDATSVISSYNATLRQWDIGGAGVAMITGFDATPGEWNVNLSQTGASFVFDASEASTVPVPDGGSSLLLLGSSMLSLGALGRKFSV